MPTTTLTDADFDENGTIDVLGMLVVSGLCASRGEARRLVQQGGVTVDEKKVDSIDARFAREQFADGGLIVRKGKKAYHKLKT